MKENTDFAERRQFERSNAQNLIVGVLNPDKPLFFGIIKDISLGGARYTHEFTMAPDDNPIHTIDLIAEEQYISNIPCECAWRVPLETESSSKLTSTMQCGIHFVRLTPKQIALLRDFIDRCTSVEIKAETAKINIANS